MKYPHHSGQPACPVCGEDSIRVSATNLRCSDPKCGYWFAPERILTVLVVGKTGPAFSPSADPTHIEVTSLDPDGDVTQRRVFRWPNRIDALDFAMQAAVYAEARS